MSLLAGKKIIVGITGSIAAYKSALLVRALIKQGAEVQVLMTPAAAKFITPLTLSTLSKRPVFSDVTSEGQWNSHVELGLWADAMVVAPLSANTLAKMATGICDSMISAVYLSCRAPVFVAPAMDLDMWAHPATQANIQKLQQYGNHVIPVGEGELASGLVGAGRMAEPEEIVEHLVQFFHASKPLRGKTVTITAGPTYEHIDPVRFIGNHSSGKMGIALAAAAANLGANVNLVLGPTKETCKHPGVTVIPVVHADQMMQTCAFLHPDTDITIFAAAVADYKPAHQAEEKIKKTGETLHLNLIKTPDIAATLGQKKSKQQFHIGFALETGDGILYAKNKMQTKNFDFVVLNSLQDAGAGFGHDTNKVTLFFKDGTSSALPLLSKQDVANHILEAAIERLPTD